LPGMGAAVAATIEGEAGAAAEAAPVVGKFVTGSLFRHIAVMSLTSSVGLMAIFVVDLINMLYMALTARAVGMRDAAAARRRTTEGLILGAGFGVIFAAVVWLVLPWIVQALGATGRTAEEALHFLRILIPSQPLLMVGMIGAGVLRGRRLRGWRSGRSGGITAGLVRPRRDRSGWPLRRCSRSRVRRS